MASDDKEIDLEKRFAAELWLQEYGQTLNEKKLSNFEIVAPVPWCAYKMFAVVPCPLWLVCVGNHRLRKAEPAVKQCIEGA